MERTYPYSAWVLQPSFKPKEVTFVRHSTNWNGSEDYGCETQSGKCYQRSQIHPTKAAAIAFGREEVKRMQGDLDKKQASLNKKTESLDKATL